MRLTKIFFDPQDTDVLSLSLIDTDLYTCLSDGEIQRWSGSFACTASWQAHHGIVLSSIIVPARPSPSSLPSSPTDTVMNNAEKAEKGWALITGASDSHIKACTVTCSPWFPVI